MAPQAKPDTKRIWALTAPPNNVEDPDVTLANRFTNGWVAEKPPFENFNFLQNLWTKAHAYINEQGIGLWDVATTYPISAIVKGLDDNTYIAAQQNTGNEPTVDGGTNWNRNAATKNEFDALNSSVAANIVAIDLNTDKNAEQELEIDNNLSLITSNTDAIVVVDAIAGANQSAIVQLNTDLDTTNLSVTNNGAAIGANTAAININTASITNNGSAIAVNAAAIAANTVAINNIPSATQATETTAGIAEIATQVEVDDGTEVNPYVNPKTLKSITDALSSGIFGANGSISLKMSNQANDIIIKWGRVAVAIDTDAWTTVALPITAPALAFTNNFYFITGQQSGSGLTSPGDSFGVRLKAASLTEFDFYSNDAVGTLEIAFIAIGD